MSGYPAGRADARQVEAACRLVRAAGGQVAQTHLRHLNPFPSDLGEVLGRYDRVLVPEMNLGYGFGGQLGMLVRAKYLVDTVGYHQVRGLPFKAEELAGVITSCIDDIASEVLQ